MVVLNFTLTPEAAAKVHDLLVCLGKFSDTVAVEARRERVGHTCDPIIFVNWEVLNAHLA
jgi:cell cycle checkpoint control protein RAD9A